MAVDRGNQEELSMRLDQTICRYKGHPYFVITSGYAETIYPNVGLCRLNSSRMIPSIIVDHRDPDFDDSAVPLGYLNWADEACYLKRIPQRVSAQGLRSNSIEMLPRPRTSGARETSWFTAREMESCILGRYPSLNSVLSWLRESGRVGASKAIHREIAVSLIDSRRMGLLYKGRLVATSDSVRDVSNWTYLDNPDASILRRIIEKTGVLKS